jgi:tetrahydromethanopterin S-methyltransferase subunit E
MRIGSSIGLIAVGLILALAVNFDVDGLDVQQIGWILAVVGVIGLVVSLVMARRARPVVTREAYPPVVREEAPLPPTRPDPRYQDPNARF